jgi:alpha-mannosidase
VNELSGKDIQNTELMLNGEITDAYEVNGQEQEIGPVRFSGNKLHFDLTHYTIRSFAVKIASPSFKNETIQKAVNLPFNQDVMSFDDNRADGNLGRGSSIPAEMVPREIISEGIRFRLGSTKDGENNAVRCKGQEIELPGDDFDHLYILATAILDTGGDFTIDQQVYPLKIQQWNGFVGQFYNRKFAQDGITVTGIDSPFVKQDNIAWFATHSHQAYPSKNLAYEYCYLYKYEIELPAGAKKIILPDNGRILVLAITVAKGEGKEVKALQSLYDDFEDAGDVSLR